MAHRYGKIGQEAHFVLGGYTGRLHQASPSLHSERRRHPGHLLHGHAVLPCE
jgi:hypothetical protein